MATYFVVTKSKSPPSRRGSLVLGFRGSFFQVWPDAWTTEKVLWGAEIFKVAAYWRDLWWEIILRCAIHSITLRESVRKRGEKREGRNAYPCNISSRIMVPNGLRPIGLSTSISRIKSCRGRWFPGNSVSHKGGNLRYRTPEKVPWQSLLSPWYLQQDSTVEPFLDWPGGSPYRNEELYFVSRRSSCKLHRHEPSTIFPPWVFDMLIYFGDMFHYVSLPPALQYCVMLVCPRGIRRLYPCWTMDTQAGTFGGLSAKPGEDEESPTAKHIWTIWEHFITLKMSWRKNYLLV